jgi:hypothetical protein
LNEAQTYYCTKCKQTVDQHGFGNLAACAQCGVVHENKLALKEQALPSHLQSALEGLQLTHNGVTYDIHGIAGLHYCESIVYLLFTKALPNKVFVWYYYDWFLADWVDDVQYKGMIAQIQHNHLTKSFFGKSCLCLSKGDVEGYYLAGTVQLPVHTHTARVLHLIDGATQYLVFYNAQYKYAGLEMQLIEASANKIFFYKPLRITTTSHGVLEVPYFPITRSVANTQGIGFSIRVDGTCSLANDKVSEWHYYIALGSKGHIRGTDYTVIGIADKVDNDGYSWQEYTLLNELEGFAYLSVFSNNWIFLKPFTTTEAAEIRRSQRVHEINDEDKEFELFNDYTAKLTNSAGAFIGDVFNDKRVLVAEFIAPPEMISYEAPASEPVSAFRGWHMPTQELQDAFPEAHIYRPHSMGALSPNPVGTTSSEIFKLALAAFIVALACLIVPLALKSKHDGIAISRQYISAIPNTDQAAITPAFELTNASNTLKFEFSSNLNNNWIEYAVQISNTTTGSNVEFEVGNEYYSGYEGGENWSEGERTSSFIAEQLERGAYTVKITPSSPNDTQYTVNITDNVFVWRNFWIIFFAMFIPTLIVALWSHSAEVSRWENSPYDKYGTDK